MAYHGLHSCLWFAIFLTVVIAIAGVSHSDSVLNSLCDSQKCVCQINVAPGSNDCQSDDSLVRENARMNETIWLLQDEIRRLKGSQGNGCQSDDSLKRENARMNETIWLLQDEIRRLKGSQGNGCQSDDSLARENENARMNETIWLLQDEIRRLKGSQEQRDQNTVITLDGARWRAFWWYKTSSGWPKSLDDVLGGEYGSCDPRAPYCFARLPKELSEAGAEMLGKDSAGNTYRWTFKATNPTSHAVWRAFHDHEQTPAGTVKNSHIWNPKVVEGNGPTKPQDSFMYRTEHGVTSLLLDDDNCDCLTSLSLGHGMCGAGFSTTYGPANRFGVDLLYDPKCQTPSPDNGLTLFFRDDDDCVNVDCGPGFRCRDGIGKYTCVV